MSVFNEIKAYFNNKFSDLKKACEDKKMQNYLHLYFDNNGNGLNPEQIQKVNDFLRKCVVLNDTNEIDKFTTEITTLATFKSGKEHLTKQRRVLLDKLKNGKIISKSEACLISRNIIIQQPAFSRVKYDANGDPYITEVPLKKYVISIFPNTTQVIFSRKYNNEPIEKREGIDKAISLFNKVSTKAYSAFKNADEVM